MSETKEIVIKAIKMRKYTLKNGIVKRDAMLMHSYVKKFEMMLIAFPKMNDEQWKNFLKRHWNEFLEMVPASKSGKSLIEKVQTLIL